jgi:hypothetical protein
MGSAWPETAPVAVGGEEGGGWPLRPQCRWAGGSAGQCTCTGGYKGYGWRRLWCLDSRRGGGQWGAPASFGWWRQRTRWGGSELRPSEYDGVGSAWSAQEVGAPFLGPPVGQLSRMQRGQGAHARRVRAWPWARTRWPMCGPRRDGVRTAGDVGPAWAPARRQRRDVACKARSGVPTCFRFAEAPFDRFKLKNFELMFKFAKYESCRLDNLIQLS